MNKIYIPYSEMLSEFGRILLKFGFTDEKAEICARIFTDNSLDGVYSHGVHRFPRFVNYITKGFIDVHAEPVKKESYGALEQWDGRLGPGPLNAAFCTDRAMHLAQKYGLGCVALSNTNHWMRGGTYGWQAAKKGYAFMGWTNTIANMPPWGSKERKLGNNPLVFAVPFKEEAIVLDFAMTQYSYGKMEATQMENEKLPFPGGFNEQGELTTDPGEILKSRRALPVGYWKGAGLSLLLDIMAAMLSAGLPTHELSKKEAEYGVCQVFIVFIADKLTSFPFPPMIINKIISDFKTSAPDETKKDIRYPGERVIHTRTKNLQKGIPVDKNIWEEILNL